MYADIFHLEKDHISDRDVIEQVTEAWPGSPDFSDWDKFKGSDKRTLYDIKSVMTYPFHHLFLKPELTPAHINRERAAFPSIAQVKRNLKILTEASARGDKPNGHKELYGLLTHPTDADVANVIRMYKPPQRSR